MRQDRLLEIVGRIYQRPETWNQNVYHTETECGTAHCVAGHAEVDAGEYMGTMYIRRTTWSSAVRYLDLNENQASWLFDPDRKLEEIIAFAISPDHDPWRNP